MLHLVALALAGPLTPGTHHGATTGSEQPPALDVDQALDLALAAYSGRSTAELADPDVREASKTALLEQIEKAYEHEVVDVCYTEFVMQ